MKLKRLTNLNKEYDMYIKWRLTDYCNLDCSYCIRSHITQHNLTNAYITEQEQKLSNTAKKLNELLEKSIFSNVNIDLIGGEVSLFNLEYILSFITSKKLKKINITTNFLKPAKYYNSLANFLKERGVKLSITASFHFEYFDFESYFNKVLEVKDNCYLFACEMVSLPDNQELCQRFKERCDSWNIDYLIEADLRFSHDLSKPLLVCGNKKNKGNRYEVEFTDGTIKEYATRNLFLTDKSIEENRNQKGICTHGFICTNGWNYLFIYQDKAITRKKGSKTCSNEVAIDDFELIEPFECQCDENTFCTLCGNMDLIKCS